MSDSPIKIVVVDTDKEVLDSVTDLLSAEKYEVITVDNSRKAIEIAKELQPDLILLELVMPELDGIDICLELRKDENLNNTLIVFHTTRAEDYSQIAAFNAGADDYIVKPIKPRVLTTRIKALLKRHLSHHHESEKIESDGIVIDRERYLVFKNKEEIVLPRKEFELLALLMTAPRKVFTRKEISETIWGYEIVANNRTIDVHIRKLREKIGDEYIRTIKGVGYTLEV